MRKYIKEDGEFDYDSFSDDFSKTLEDNIVEFVKRNEDILKVNNNDGINKITRAIRNSVE